MFNELSRRDPSLNHLRQVIDRLESFLSRNAVTLDLEHKLEAQHQDTAALARAINDFLHDSLAAEQQRDHLISRYGNETLTLLDSGEDAGLMVQKLRVLVTDMLRHYRDEAQAWEHRAKELERTVNVDPLLAPLHNRRALDEHLSQAVSRAQAAGSALAVLMIDVDNFKTTINDIHGHQVGDDVLRTLAKIINAHATKHGWFAARFGGDELVLVCPVDAQKAQLFAEAVRLAVQQYEFRPRVGGRLLDTPIRFTVSIGVAEYQPGMAWQDLLGAADEAMYQVKGAGKNNVLRYFRLSETS